MHASFFLLLKLAAAQIRVLVYPLADEVTKSALMFLVSCWNDLCALLAFGICQE